jgi:hypothetical protein
LASVVLPEPFSPTSAITSPRPISRFTSLVAWRTLSTVDGHDANRAYQLVVGEPGLTNP